MGPGLNGHDMPQGGTMSACRAQSLQTAFVAEHKEKNTLPAELFNQHIYF